ncbi:MAG: hypothetical protein BAJALOKI2v1_50010 [Promethearchaeota archaeon]|nr:MAG: hypothetical protein BAJALOKI2v1_50010 [Candidatus Lokiarchaeota archaeon]
MLRFLFISLTFFMVLFGALLTINKYEKEYYCPKCDSFEIYDYGTRFECMHCNLEFDKKDFKLLNNGDVLSVQEKLEIITILLDK